MNLNIGEEYRFELEGFEFVIRRDEGYKTRRFYAFYDSTDDFATEISGTFTFVRYGMTQFRDIDQPNKELYEEDLVNEVILYIEQRFENYKKHLVRWQKREESYEKGKQYAKELKVQLGEFDLKAFKEGFTDEIEY